MKKINNACGKAVLTLMAMLLIVLTGGCGKKDKQISDKVENQLSKVEKFSTDFFNNCNLPYQKLQITDVQNTADEYLFYISGGAVYRTLSDCSVVITERKNIRETAEQIGTNYSGEIYHIFEGDDIDVLKYSACGDYAIMTNLSAISDWSQNEIITSFMNYAADYQ